MSYLSNTKKTKIVATVGPASSDYATLLQMARAGVDVFRLNFSHGTHDQHLEVIKHICYINETYRYHVSILADLQGPKLRVGEMENGGVEISEGDIITFTNEKCIGTKEKVYMSYKDFARDVNVNERVRIDDGKLELVVVETDKKSEVKLKVVFGGILKSRKGVNLPNTDISLPCLTAKDLVDLDFILTQPVHWIALSFVRSAADMEDLRERVEAKGHEAKILAKVEKPEALRHLDAVIDASDAIMVARGDLGVEVPIEKLPRVQKDIIQRCIQKARPVIVATQMMESMITNFSPTRAEVTDVANAVIDGTDAVMLSGETSVGNHPVKVVQAMSNIIREAEKLEEVHYKGLVPNPAIESFLADAICYNTCKIAGEIGARAVIGMTNSGYTAFKIASNRPNSRIYIFSQNETMLSILNLVWGIRAFYYDKYASTDDTIHDVQQILKDKQLLESGDVVINTGSMPIQKRLRTNMLKITKIE